MEADIQDADQKGVWGRNAATTQNTGKKNAMYSILLLSACAFLLCLAMTPLVRNHFLEAGIVDQPDCIRKRHARAVPRVGGLPIALSMLGAFGILIASPLSGSHLVIEHLPLIWRLLPIAGFVLVIGLVDDLWTLRPAQKLAAQCLASTMAWLAGVRITGIVGIAAPEWLSFGITVLWLVGCTNAFNLIDGLDGLASGLGLFATCTILAVGLLKEDFALALATAPLAGALLGFLRYNFNPASIFLGDCGSLFIGFLLGCYGALWSQKSATIFGLTAPLLAMAVPILDVLLSMGRRFLRGKPMFAADRGHIHHRLLDRGLTPRRVALLLYMICFLGSTLSLFQSVFENQLSGLVLVLFATVVWVGIGKLGYIEFDVTLHALSGGALRKLVSEQILLRQFEHAVAKAETVDECWTALRTFGQDIGLRSVKLRLCSEEFSEVYPGNPEARTWSFRIPIRQGEYVDCSKEIESEAADSSLAGFARVVADSLGAKAGTLQPSLALNPQLAELARNLAALEVTPQAIEP